MIELSLNQLTVQCDKVEVVKVKIKNALLCPLMIDETGVELENNNRFHSVWKVTTKAREEWVVDPTAVQYGWTEFLVRWPTWCAERVEGSVEHGPNFKHYNHMFQAYVEAGKLDLFDYYLWSQQAALGNLVFGMIERTFNGSSAATGKYLKDLFQGGELIRYLEREKYVFDVLEVFVPKQIERYYQARTPKHRENEIRSFMESQGLHAETKAHIKAYEAKCLQDYEKASKRDPKTVIDLDKEEAALRAVHGNMANLSFNTRDVPNAGVNVYTSSTGFRLMDAPGGGLIVEKLPAKTGPSKKRSRVLTAADIDDLQGAVVGNSEPAKSKKKEKKK